MAADKDGIPPTFRTRLRALVDSIGDDVELRDLLRDALSLERLRWATAHVDCKHCGKTCRTRVQIDSPDYAGYLKVLATLSDQAYGRPKQEEPKEENVVTPAVLQAIREEIREALTGVAIPS